MKSLITRVLLAADFSQCATRALEHALAVTLSWNVKEPMLEGVLEWHNSQSALVESAPASY